MEALEKRLAVVEDREAIRDLLARYGFCVDRGDSVGAAALWAEDGTYDVGGYGVYRGRAAIAALMDGEAHQALLADGVAHILSPPAIDLDGDVAHARTYSCVMRRAGEHWEAYRVSANRWRLVRTGQGWRVAERINRLLDGDQAAWALLAD